MILWPRQAPIYRPSTKAIRRIEFALLILTIFANIARIKKHRLEAGVRLIKKKGYLSFFSKSIIS